MKIGKRFVGDGEPCFIVAEAGVNHNGSLKLAKKLIDAAAKAGADAVKFQSFRADKLVLKKTPKAGYQKRTTGKKGTQYQMLKRLELSEKEQRALAKYAKIKKIIFFSTPYDLESVELLKSLRVPAYKVASADIVNIPLIERITKTKKPVIMSTGMATLGEVKHAIGTVRSAGNNKIILMHCISEYPPEIKDSNLRVMQTLKRNFGTVVGYSDNSAGLITPLAAVALGAKVIEKHFTLSRRMKGPDHFASLEPDEFKQMVEEIRTVESALGTEKKILTKAEKRNKRVMRRGIYAAVKIKKGTRVKIGMLAFMRPESSLKSSDYKKVVGKKVTKDIKTGQELKLSYFKA